MGIPEFAGATVTVNSPPGSQDGIIDGTYDVVAELVIGGAAHPFLDLSIDLNAYSATGAITGSVPQLVDGEWRDFSAEAQKNPYVPLLVRVGYVDRAEVSGDPPVFQIESGFLDETTDNYDADMMELVARGVASVFQDAQVADTAQFNRAGSDLAALYAQKMRSKLRSVTIVPSVSGNSVGKAGYTEAEYLKANRARTMWDELVDAALLDSYIVRVRNGDFYYGPPAAANTFPVIGLKWIGVPGDPQQGDMLSCKVQHAARKTHNISVRVDGTDYGKKVHNTVVWPPGSPAEPTDGRIQFRVIHNPGDKASLKRIAQAMYEDLVHREYIATIEFVPDPPFMQMLAQRGSDFLISLSGIKPSQEIIYNVRHCKVDIVAGDSEEPSLKITCTAVNHEDLADGQDAL